MDSAERHPILVVDDDDVILSAVEFALVDEGYEVVTATNGKEALERIEDVAPRVILMDMKMPTMDGWAFARAYRAQPGPHSPIIVMTAAHDAKKWASEIDADDCIAKPFDLERLLDLVRSYAE